MSAPQQHVQPGPTGSGKKNKNRQMAPPRNAMSENEASGPNDLNRTISDQSRGHKKSHASRKAITSGNASDTSQHTKAQATPIKTHYAQTAFRQSPAASSLPIPKAFSKSVPAKQPAPILESHAEQDPHNGFEAATPTKRESTPLDFMFDAARRHKDTPRDGSPAAQQGTHSRPSRSPAARSPAPESMFAIELDGATTPGEEGISSTPSYRERINSAQPAPATSNSIRAMDEAERKAKTDALKKMLLMGPQDSPSTPDPNNPFNARAPQPRSHTAQPSSNQAQHNPYPQYSANMNRPTSRDQYLGSQQLRPPSGLRYEALSEAEAAEMSSDNAITPPRTSMSRSHANHVVSPAQPPVRTPAQMHAGPTAQLNYSTYGSPGVHAGAGLQYPISPSQVRHNGHFNGPPPPNEAQNYFPPSPGMNINQNTYAHGPWNGQPHQGYVGHPPVSNGHPHHQVNNQRNGPHQWQHVAPRPEPVAPPPGLEAAHAQFQNGTGSRIQQSPASKPSAQQMEQELWSVLNVGKLNLSSK